MSGESGVEQPGELLAYTDKLLARIKELERENRDVVTLNERLNEMFDLAKDRVKESAAREADLTAPLAELLKINQEVNKLPVGNFYLPETMDGFMALKPASALTATKEEGQ